MNIEELKKLGTIVHYDDDEPIFLQGEYGDSLYIILRGKVKISISNSFDGGHVELAELGEGAIFGEMSIITGESRSASATSATDLYALKIGRDNFERFITLEPRFAVNMMRTLSERYFKTMMSTDGKEEAPNG